MEDIDYIDIMLSDYSIYRILKDNIELCDYSLKNTKIDVSNVYDTEFEDYDLIESLMLIIKDYNKIIDCDETKFDINRTDISQIEINYENGEAKSYYINMTDLNNNKNQKNITKDYKLYIAIEEE